jgi:hypothetical protein
MLDLIAAHTEQPIAVVAAMPKDDLSTMAKAHWPELWIAPGTGNNTSKLWLIPAKYTTKLQQAKLFEDFSELVGVDIWNPARDIPGVQIANPIKDLAETTQISLRAIINPTEDEVEADVLELVGTLRASLREYLGPYSEKFSDDALNAAIFTPDEPLFFACENLVEELSAADVITLMRSKIMATRPLFNAGITDEDIMAAAAKPEAPLHASRLCQFQAMFCDVNTPVEHRFQFTDGNVCVNLWSPMSDKRPPQSRKKEVKADAPESTAPVAVS